MKNFLFGKDIVSIDSLSKEHVELIFEKTREMAELVKKKDGDRRLEGKIITTAFFEPSTRTYSSFVAAAQRLGAGIIPLNGMTNTSVAKGESFEHTIKVLSRYSNCLVVRHPEPGKPAEAAGFVDIPVINAGDGINEHPTQGLFDTYTIRQYFGKIDGLTVVMVGDLKNGRTVHSLTKTLVKMGKLTLIYVAPGVLRMPNDVRNTVVEMGGRFDEVENLASVISLADVVYMTRVQKERFLDHTEYERLKDYYVLDKSLLHKVKKNALIMHPLPIAGEITSEVDSDSRAIYLTQELSNGLYLRMALLDLLLLQGRK